MKNIYYQATSYTTDHCDGDLIAPVFWNPTKDRAKSAKEIIDEVIADLCHIATKKQPGPDFIKVEYRKNEPYTNELCEPDDTTDWCEPVKVTRHLTRRNKFIQKLEAGLADGSIGTLLLTQPEYVTFIGLIAEYKNVYHIQEFKIPGTRKASRSK